MIHGQFYHFQVLNYFYYLGLATNHISAVVYDQHFEKALEQLQWAERAVDARQEDNIGKAVAATPAIEAGLNQFLDLVGTRYCIEYGRAQ